MPAMRQEFASAGPVAEPKRNQLDRIRTITECRTRCGADQTKMSEMSEVLKEVGVEDDDGEGDAEVRTSGDAEVAIKGTSTR